MTGAGPAPTVRTTKVIVHVMGKQLPLETLDWFVPTALPEVGGERRYFSRSAETPGSRCRRSGCGGDRAPDDRWRPRHLACAPTSPMAR
jgi:hypothetical protein